MFPGSVSCTISISRKKVDTGSLLITSRMMMTDDDDVDRDGGGEGCRLQYHQNGKKTHTHLIPPWEDQCEWHRMTRMTGPDCAVMCNLINTYTHTHIVWSSHDIWQSMNQPGKVANPARGQLNRENEYSPFPVRAWEFSLARRVWQSRTTSACSSPYSD